MPSGPRRQRTLVHATVSPRDGQLAAAHLPAPESRPWAVVRAQSKFSKTAFGNEASDAAAAEEQQAHRATAQETAADEHSLRHAVDDARVGHTFRAHAPQLLRQCAPRRPDPRRRRQLRTASSWLWRTNDRPQVPLEGIDHPSGPQIGDHLLHSRKRQQGGIVEHVTCTRRHVRIEALFSLEDCTARFVRVGLLQDVQEGPRTGKVLFVTVGGLPGRVTVGVSPGSTADTCTL